MNTKTPWALALHGGAGTISKEVLGEREGRYRERLARALGAGRDILERNGPALDAVEATVAALEDDALFNAGHGSVLTSSGRVEMDAAIMDGENLAAGSVIGIETVRNPVALARRVLEHGVHVVLAGAGAEAFARSQGMEPVARDWFVTEMRRDQLRKAQAANVTSLDHNDGKYGTVGAVARDRMGNLAAATSTGGMTNKLPGRVGDAPLIGAGTYASNRSCAVSATGHGEMFIRLTVARDIAARMEFGGENLDEAVQRMVMEALPAIGGAGGVISVARTGRPVLKFSTPGMYRASQCEGGAPQVAMFED